ncbi:hypothetical protein BX616_003973 [Lobosporangium transversale]|uniref:Uncharacterized protein n=1 Tax=Lobosporangium transversale TaxID=64571 RepID=A0A1Y2GYW5_9FUNG|nr:hypothetical protein BCR41DRAFT_346885 [Lobosporangium transversale]KAF9918938.1 hypothetical protein BX616_003973 [Lobosporangium transversale]ORZ27499.1 hypothetical protein BCR41DRAFT_346885 [Lobosporangium transversale]|eukprot:XP_021885226.1 hypothetical protein BCR41DRAFT_346885 [Lobosporangium transversale]
MDQLKHRSNNTKALFRGQPLSDESQFMAEDEQEQLIESLRKSNEKANDAFKFVLLLFSIMEIFIHLGFTAYAWSRNKSMSGLPLPDNADQSISPGFATIFSLISFFIGIFIIWDMCNISRTVVVGWTFVSSVPLVLMMGSTEFSFELMWWSMPLLLQAVDLASLWIMRDPDEDFLRLEKSQYKLKSA